MKVTPLPPRWTTTLFCACGCLFLTFSLAASPDVVPYGGLHMSPASQAFSVKVNGQPVFTHGFMNYDYAHFAFAGTAKVEVTFRDEIANGVAVTPSKYKIAPTIRGKTFTFTLQEPRKLFIRTNVRESISYWSRTHDHHFLVLFADALETDPPVLGQADTVSVLDHGADKSGAKDSAAAINAAIKACPKNGTVYVPAGKYRLDSSVDLDTPEMTFYLEGDAFLQKLHGPGAVILRADGVTVKGRGTIEADSYAMRSAARGDRPVRKFLLEDVVLRDSHVSTTGEFHMMARFTLNEFQIRNIKALGCPQNETYGKQRDGFALDDTINGVVDNIFSWSGDDAFYVWSRHRPSENILVKNCLFRAEGGAAAMKDMSLLLVRNLHFVDCVSLRGALEVDSPEATGRQEDVLFKNIDVEELANLDVAGVFGTKVLDADVHAVFENVRFLTIWPRHPSARADSVYVSSHFIVKATDRVNVQFKGLKVKGQVITNREQLAQAGFNVIWEGSPTIGFSAQ
ncbi:MAG: glycosyl hydrolase family 28-related protein [Thermoguttaceae bacterium]